MPDPESGRIYRVTRANISNVRDTEQHYTSCSRRTPGARQADDPARAPLRAPGTGRARPARFTLGNNWAPRFGVTYNPPVDGKHEDLRQLGLITSRSIPNDLAARVAFVDAGVSRADYYDAGLTQPIPEGVFGRWPTRHFAPTRLSRLPSSIPNVKFELQERSRSPGSNSKRLPGLNLSARYIHRDISRELEDVQPIRSWPSISVSRAPTRWTTSLTNPVDGAPADGAATSARVSRNRGIATTPSRSAPTSASPTGGPFKRRIAGRGWGATFEGFSPER